MVYLVCYDVVDDRRRYKVAKLLKGYGLRVQKSVFECKLEDQQYEYVQKMLLRIIKRHEDQLRFYPLSAHCRNKVKILGMQPSVAVDDKAFIV